MAPNPKIINAFRAMKAIGISEDKVKPVLKRLLKLYEKNWELIEEENYRVLADAIFEEEDSFEEETQAREEPERPLKRLRLHGRNEEGLPSSSLNNGDHLFDGTPLKEPKVEMEAVPASDFLRQSPDTRKSQPKNVTPPDHARNTGKQPVSPVGLAIHGSVNPSHPDSLSPVVRHSYKGKEPMVPEVAYGGKRPERASHSVQFRDPVDPGTALLPNSKVTDTLALIIPKDEPFTDDMPLTEIVPIASVRPDNRKGDSSHPSILARQSVGQEISESRSVAAEDRGDNILTSSSETRTLWKLPTNPEKSPANLEIASSPLGEVKMSLSCKSLLGRPNFHMPSQDELLKSMQEKCLRSYKIIDPNFSVMQMLKDICECFLELATDTSHESQERIMSVVPTLNQLNQPGGCRALSVPGIQESKHMRVSTSNGSVDGSCFGDIATPQIPRVQLSVNGLKDKESREGVTQNGYDENDRGKALANPDLHSVVVIPQCQLPTEELRSLHDFNDVTKGEEIVEVPWLNEMNNECPPFFCYIPRNLVYQNACVKLTLSQITDKNCCSTCIGDCLSSRTPCVCADETEHEFAYTSEGLVREDFLEDCISMTRDPQRQCHSYCEDCPLERAKNDGMLEACKGHLRRKYIKECWNKCGCHKQCGNRVVQRGIRHKLQIFFTLKGKGWGLRALEKLPKGTFVCEYVGEILTSKEFYERNKQRTRSTSTYPVFLDAYWSLKRALKDEEALCLDATFHGNVARFINHRCLDANLIEIPVKIETPDHHYYHLAFFTTREVDALEELTWDYGIDFDDSHLDEAFRCQCGSKFCRNMKRTNRSKGALR